MSVERWGWTEGGVVFDETDNGAFVHFSDYQKLVDALRLIRRNPAYNQEIAEAALLSAGEQL